MFSTGNVTEKARVARFPVRGKVVVDMFVGIGYFTIPLLVRRPLWQWCVLGRTTHLQCLALCVRVLTWADVCARRSTPARAMYTPLTTTRTPSSV